MGLFDLVGEEPIQQESADNLIRGFRSKAPCNLCPLSEVNPGNTGFIYRGNPNAEIAVLTDTPFGEDIGADSVFAGPGRSTWEHWVRWMNTCLRDEDEKAPLSWPKLNQDSFFVTFVAQCRTDKDVVVRKRKKGKKNVLAVDPENANKGDLLTCFNLHTYQVLRALPNLKVIIATGKIAIQMLLKEDFQYERHAGNFFISDFFPNVPVFCMDAPRNYEIAGDFKLTQMEEHLDFFKYKFLKTRSICRIHAYYKDCLDRGVEVNLNHQV